jgi:hypothetical protein
MILEAVLNEPVLSLPDRFCHIRAIQGVERRILSGTDDGLFSGKTA